MSVPAARAWAQRARELLRRLAPALRWAARHTRALSRWAAQRTRASLRWLGPVLMRALRGALALLRRGAPPALAWMRQTAGALFVWLRELPPQRLLLPAAIGALLATLCSCCPAQPAQREQAGAGSSGGERTESNRRGAVLRGDASYYANFFRGRKTANGERYDPRKFTAANRTLPLGTRLRVTRLDTGKSVVVRVNDRGPFGKRSRILDLSRAAAEELDMIKIGHTQVEAVVLE